MKKTIKILYSPWFGDGFYTWNKEYPAVLKDKFIIDLVEKDKSEDESLSDETVKKICKYLNKNYSGFHTGGVEDLCIQEIPEGTKFRIDQDRWDESIIISDDRNLIA